MDACIQVLPEIPADRIIHVNFANVDELNEYHQKFYYDTAPVEHKRLMDKLREFDDEIAPGAKDIKEFMANSYTKDLKKKGVLPSFVTDLAAAGGRAAGRLSGGEGQ